jgi:DNA-directed RNA polymerase subunit RPC12/RpoP
MGQSTPFTTTPVWALGIENLRPHCPDCDMRMIVTKGAKLEPERKTYECLRCGHEQNPGPGEVY